MLKSTSRCFQCGRQLMLHPKTRETISVTLLTPLDQPVRVHKVCVDGAIEEANCKHLPQGESSASPVDVKSTGTL